MTTGTVVLIAVVALAVGYFIGKFTGSGAQPSTPPQPPQPPQPPGPGPTPVGPVPTIAILDHVGVPGLAAIVAGLQEQLSNEFLAAWGLTAKLVVKSTPDAGDWWCAILKNADQAGALGYHDVTNEGLPLAKVFTEVSAQAGAPISGVLSHELMEMIADPGANLWGSNPDGSQMIAYEDADPVESDSYQSSNGTVLSNFVFPAWWETFRAPGSTQFDYMKKLTAPVSMTPGGYEIVASGAQVGQVTARAEVHATNVGKLRFEQTIRDGLYPRHQLRQPGRRRWSTSDHRLKPARRP